MKLTSLSAQASIDLISRMIGTMRIMLALVKFNATSTHNLFYSLDSYLYTNNHEFYFPISVFLFRGSHSFILKLLKLLKLTFDN